MLWLDVVDAACDWRDVGARCAELLETWNAKVVLTCDDVVSASDAGALLLEELQAKLDITEPFDMGEETGVSNVFDEASFVWLFAGLRRPTSNIALEQ